jgi:hypothetical protein
VVKNIFGERFAFSYHQRHNDNEQKHTHESESTSNVNIQTSIESPKRDVVVGGLAAH